MPINARVGAGRSALKCSKTSLNTGTTQTIMTSIKSRELANVIAG